MAWKTIVTTERREKARDAAEELCRKVRLDVTKHGAVTQDVLVYLRRWMRVSANSSTLYLTCYVPAGFIIAGLIRFVLDR